MNTQVTITIEDNELLHNLSIDELEALADSILVPTTQNQLKDLLSKNAEAKLLPEETMILDRLLTQIDNLNILKTRARYTLQHLLKN
jgi:hypothetical protein